MGKTEVILPDFLIIGANKAGTTSVANYLNSHPEISFSSVKEPMFFCSDPNMKSAPIKNATLEKPFFTVTLQAYSETFNKYKPGARIFGEASTAYLAAPKRSAKIIKKIVPNIKLIAILREPAERAISAYKMCCGLGYEKRSFSDVVKESRDHQCILDVHNVKDYIRNGLYSQLLEEYLRYFEPHQLLILNFDELKSNPHGFLNKIVDFLGVSSFQFDTSKKYNVGAGILKEDILIEDNDVRSVRKMFYFDLKKLQSMVDIDIERWIDLAQNAF